MYVYMCVKRENYLIQYRHEHDLQHTHLAENIQFYWIILYILGVISNHDICA